VVVAIFSGVCVLFVAAIAVGVYFFSQPDCPLNNRQPTPVITLVASSQQPGPSSESEDNIAPPNPSQNQASPPEGVGQTENTLNAAVVPVANRRDLAERLSRIGNIPETVPALSTPLQIGDRRSFFVLNTDTNTKTESWANLRYITPHGYFWEEDHVQLNLVELKSLAEDFENRIYPTNREFFGSEWSPGVDNDVHLYILFTRGLGKSVAGYFSSGDEYPPQVQKFSNAHEIFFLNANRLGLSSEYTYSVLAHEFQHMIHWHRDPNEDAWMNEGFSVLAEFLNDYDLGGFDFSFAANPDLQLNNWPGGFQETAPNYGASFLFLTFFLDRFGEDVTKSLVGEASNGLASIDQVLATYKIVDPRTQKPLRADDVFGDWVVANYLHDPRVGDGRFTYHIYESAPQVEASETIDRCPIGGQDREVDQYGADYIRITCPGRHILRFSGSTAVDLVAKPHSGSYVFWSNRGDESDMRLTHSFDFSGQTGSLTLEFWTRYDLEKDYDFVYLEVREKGGDWTILHTPAMTDQNISGNSYGWAYNDASPGWIKEKVDLSAYAGKQVELRFEYVTDDATNGEGLLLDDIAIPEINYDTDFETDDGGWIGEGFVRIENQLPQKFRLALITQGQETSVETISSGEGQTVEIPIQIDPSQKSVVLVVSGITRFTTQPAKYRFSIQAR